MCTLIILAIHGNIGSMRLKQYSFLTIFILILTACAPNPPSSRVESAQATPAAQSALATIVASTLAPTATLLRPTASPTLAPSPTLPPSPTPTRDPAIPDPAVLQNRPHYKLDVDFSFNDRHGKVSEEINYTNRSADAMSELRLMVEMFQYKDLFSFTSLNWEDGQKIENPAWENIQVRIPLRKKLDPGESIGLKMTYEFSLPSQSSFTGDRPMPVGYTSRQANLVDWYPFIPPYRSGQGWLAHPPAYYGEHLVYDIADFEVNLRLTDPRKDLVVAASAPVQVDGDWLRYKRQGARNFTLSIGPDYKTLTAQVGSITITSYYFPLSQKAGEWALQTTVNAVKLYQDLFAPYPHDTLAVVEADFMDGMEYDGLFFLSRGFYNLYSGKPDDYLTAIAAHETAHQWWYALVGDDQANEPWMDEALATYTEHIYYEHYFPESLQWWWYYRVDYYHPHGWVDTSIYNPQGALQTYQDYRNAVYLNGAHFFEDLRKTVGDAAFFAFLKDYAHTYTGQVALSGDFFALLKKHTQADLKPVLQKYFSNPNR